MPAGELLHRPVTTRSKDLISFPYFVDEEDPPPQPIKPGKGLTEYVIRTGRSLLCDEATDRILRGRGEVEVVGAPSAIWLGVPLIVDGKTIGAMVVQHYGDPKAYGPAELRMLEFVSSQVARSIERKRAEAAVRESETILRVFINALPGPALLVDRDEVILEANEAMATSLGRSRNELVGRKAFESLSPEAARLRRGRLIRCLEIEQPVVFEDDRAGRSFLNYMYPVLDHNKVVNRVAVFALDMTARKEAERALLREKSFGDTIIESLPGSFFCIEVDAERMSFIRWNSTQENLLGYSAGELGGLDPLTTIAPEDRSTVAEKIAEAMASGTSSVEVALLAKAGKTIPVLMTGARAIIEGRTYVLGTAIEIGRRKEAEEALRDSEELYRRLVASIPDLIIRTDLDREHPLRQRDRRAASAGRTTSSAWSAAISSRSSRRRTATRPSRAPRRMFDNDASGRRRSVSSSKASPASSSKWTAPFCAARRGRPTASSISAGTSPSASGPRKASATAWPSCGRR